MNFDTNKQQSHNYVFCVHCGEKIPKNSKFCPFCGGKQYEDVSQSQDTNTVNNSQAYHNSNYSHQQTEQASPIYKTNRHGLTRTEQAYVNRFTRNHSKHMIPAYLLLLIFVCGTHFYLKQNAAGVILILINICTDWMVIGLIIDLIWLIIDLFMIPVWVHDNNSRAKKQAVNFVMLQRQNH